ncbi:cryptochrome/photolyase family protein [Falsirhodobacter algicola]|uniref:Deoxyribodipyrimidine photo-lyase n=1 Tax=Falsirhodobacter algicola TaxID=2692330 RepID=A0A8J8SKW8_9RHOB|nr:deoxyribodipyrimidine photo-lyase [Falsirhodobacter algicola]QUS35833.1 deoxyribodipyrimidine photo-lyase [Falsirhodobacter algicola]
MTGPAILWLRRDLRLSDHPALSAAIASGRPVLPVFVLDPETEALAAAPKWRLGRALEVFAARLEGMGSRLILRRGPAAGVLAEIAEATGAGELHLTRLHDAPSRRRDADVAEALGKRLTVHIHDGHTLHPPEAIRTKTGGAYKVYTPFWNALRQRGVAPPLPTHRDLRAPADWPRSDRLSDWDMGRAMDRGAAVVNEWATVGEEAAALRLRRFITHLDRYPAGRDGMGARDTSGLSENLTYGEIGARTLWHAGLAALQDGTRGAEIFLRELAWRDFAHHLLWHVPHLPERNWRDGWERFPWRPDSPEAEAWRRGQTGEPIVDAAMRELFTTGTMHNRARMITASYLTKHLLTDWRIGLRWFEETLIDWDPASNALNWQWVAGCGPDASPFFRIFNPATQAERFDPERRYRDRWLTDTREARAFLSAVPRSWSLAPPARITPLIGLKEGRDRALAALAGMREG